MKLDLEAVYLFLCDAEITAWNRGEALPSQNVTHIDDDLTEETVGSQILRHGKTVQNVHAYFMNFEQRKCCINLAAGKTTLTNVRIIPVAREDCDDDYLESMSRSHSPCQPSRDKLSHPEFHLYCETILCAQFPILAAPSPPLEHTPPESPEDGALSFGNLGLTVHNEFLTSLVKEEQIMELVRNVFGISQERAAQYEAMIFNLHGRQKPAKILAEELVRQLSQLENNCAPFYQSAQFLNSKGYREWQKMERQHLTEMINKFWLGPLPSLSSGRMGPHLINQNGHKHYTHLLTKLIGYTRKRFPPSELHPTFLTTDAQRLLKEFGLRYGIGEQYRTLVYLEYVATHFLQEVWYVNHASSVLCEILRTLPVTPSRLIMVVEEKKILEKCCQCFLLECENSLCKVRHIFPGFSPQVSIGLLLELLKNTLKISSFLSGEPHPPIKVLLHSWLENGFTTEYEQHKLMECYDLKLDPSRSLLSPRLLYRIIIKIRDSVRNYRNEYQAIFQSYLEIHQMAAVCFYKLLMSDVKVMCEDIQLSHTDNELSLQMVSFAYRLNQLDRDWAQYIHKHEQTWRKSYLPEVLHWVNVVQRHAVSLVLQSVASDKFSCLDIEEREVISGMTTPSCPKFPKPLSPSKMSAFSNTFHLVSQESFTHPSKTPRQRKHSQTHSSDATSRHEPVKRRILNSGLTTCSSTQTGMTLSVSDIRSHTQSPGFVKDDIDRVERNKRRISLGAVQKHQPIPTSLHRSLSSPEIHALMQRYEDIQKIQDESLLRSVDDLQPKGSRFLKDKGFPGSTQFGSLPSVNNSEHMQFDGLSQQKTYLMDPTKGSGDNGSQNDGKKRTEVEEISLANTHENFQGNRDDKAAAYASNDGPFVIKQGQVTDEVVSHEAAVRVKDVKDSREMQQKINESEVKAKRTPTPSKEYPPLQQVSHNTHLSETTKSAGINSMVIAAHKALHESSIIEISSDVKFTNLSRQCINLSEIFKEVRAKACVGGWASPDLKYGMPMTSSPLPVETTGTSYEAISGKLMVSSSVIDLVCLLRRMGNFVKTVSEVVYPLRFAEGTWGDTRVERDVDSATELRDLKEEVALGRKLLQDKLKRMVFVCVSVYSQNMLAMDMCSLTDEAGRHLAGAELLEDLHSGHDCGHIWGCRHSANGHLTPHEFEACFTYKNANPRYLASKYEPIDSQMCLRINNLCEMMDLLDQVEIDFEHSLDSERLNKELEKLHLLGETTNGEEEDVSARKDQRANARTSDGSEFFRRSKMILQATRNALLNILTYRINLFAEDALSVLLSLQLPLVSLQGRLAPLSEFLSRHLEVLRKWLVRDAYLMAADHLWELIVEDFENEERKLLALKDLAPNHAKLLLRAVAHFIGVYSSLEPELDINAMSDLTSKVTFKLEVHTLTTRRLCNVATALHNIQLKQYHESVMSNEIYTHLNEIVKRLRWCLHADRKSFTGQELLNWLLSNPQFFSISVASDSEIFGNVTPLSENSVMENSESQLRGDQEVKRRAVTLCQQLIDSNIICPLLEEKTSQKLENSGNLVEIGEGRGKLNPYPNVMECISVASSNISGLIGVRSVVSGRGYDTDEESESDGASEAKTERHQTSEVAATVHSNKDKSFISTSLRTETQMTEPITEGQEPNGLLKTPLLRSMSSPDFSKKFGVASTKQEATNQNKSPDQANNHADRNTGASETASNCSAYIFQNTRCHYYYLHSLTAVFEDGHPGVHEHGSVMDLYLENEVDFEFVMNILRARRKNDPQAKDFLKTFSK